jgi:cytidylate kinase
MVFIYRKSTLARYGLGYVYVDTGAMYRAVALFAMRKILLQILLTKIH